MYIISNKKGNTMNKPLGYMAQDQFGSTFHITEGSPRQYLLDYFDRKSARKMYHDTKDGKIRHTGYIIAGHWIRIYAVHEWKPAQ